MEWSHQLLDPTETRVREAYGDNLERLAEIKAAYDPENLFRSNRNIAPATDEGARRKTHIATASAG